MKKYELSFTKSELEHIGSVLSDDLRSKGFDPKKTWHARGANLIGRVLYALQDADNSKKQPGAKCETSQ